MTNYVVFINAKTNVTLTDSEGASYTRFKRKKDVIIDKELCGIFTTKKKAIRAFKKALAWERKHGYFSSELQSASFHKCPFEFVGEYHIYSRYGLKAK